MLWGTNLVSSQEGEGKFVRRNVEASKITAAYSQATGDVRRLRSSVGPLLCDPVFLTLTPPSFHLMAGRKKPEAVKKG